MAKSFTPTAWAKINARLDADPVRYGLPEKRDGSVVMASFNIRNLGRETGKSKGSRAFLARFVAQCDLVAVQEVLEDLSGLEALAEAAGKIAGTTFEIVASDITGGMGASGGKIERLAFLYRSDRVRRSIIASDISFDRSWVFDTMYENRKAFIAAAKEHEKALKAREEKHEAKVAAALAAGKKKPRKSKKPPFVSPQFVDFIRTPHCCAFEVPGKASAKPYAFTAINAHLLFGDKSKQAEERKREFDALVQWLLTRAAKRNSFNQDFILMGDLNLAFHKPEVQRPEIEDRIKGFNAELKKSRAATVVNFPFIDERENPITGEKQTVRSNARQSETFDQIGIFAHDKRLPGFEKNGDVADRSKPDAYDYQVFDFISLFVEALHGEGKTLGTITKTQKKDLFSRCEFDVSDHMPIWVRLPRP